ncbi:MAG TPA: hypothetical protein VE959_00515 [Bryobacteraceae bacterium]|nr:hypothetical protein [Bryobacteraceae bacterium]
MSVWPETLPDSPSLSSREGVLVSVSISVEPRRLEALLEALASLDFPINPQIYHDAALVYVYPDHHEEAEAATLVEFPAYERRMDDVRRALEASGFAAASIQVTAMLEEIHAASVPEPAPEGAAYLCRCRVKHRAAAAVH